MCNIQHLHQSRHTNTVVCQHPRKTDGTQVYYLQEPLGHCTDFYQIYIFYALHVRCSYTTLHTNFEEN